MQTQKPHFVNRTKQIVQDGDGGCIDAFENLPSYCSNYIKVNQLCKPLYRLMPNIRKLAKKLVNVFKGNQVLYTENTLFACL